MSSRVLHGVQLAVPIFTVTALHSRRMSREEELDGRVALTWGKIAC